MDNELLTAIVGSCGTVVAAVISNLPTLRDRKNHAPGSSQRRRAWIRLWVFVPIGLAVAGWAFYSFRPIESLVLRGYYRDLDPRNELPYTTHDDIILQKYRNGLVEGTTTSPIRQLYGDPLERKFRIVGYWTPTHLALSYVTDEPTPRGIGAYFLERCGNDFTGLICIRDRNAQFISPYGSTVAARVPSIISDEDVLQELWPELAAKAIYKVKLTGADPVPVDQTR